MPAIFNRGKKERERIELEQRNLEARIAQQRYDDEQRQRERADREAREARDRADEERRHREAMEIQLQLLREEERRQRQEFEAEMRQRREAEARMKAMQDAEAQRKRDERALAERLQREDEEKAKRASRIAYEKQQQENKRLEQLRNTSPESLYRLRELIRQRYQLDVKIWGMRNVMRSNHKVVINLGRESDAILQQIYDTIELFEESAFQGHPREWQIASRIREGILRSKPRIWNGNPPWNDEVQREKNDFIYM